MACDVDVKNRLSTIESTLTQVAALADECPVEIFQYDTFFVCDSDRLKLRVSPAA